MNAPAPSLRQPRPSLALSLVLFVIVTGLMAYLRLGLFRHQFITLTYGLPLLVCLWHKDRRLLWAMVLTFVAMATLKTFWLVSDPDPSDRLEGIQWLMQVGDILILGTAVHVILSLTERLRARQAQLESANAELLAREEKISQQNVELQAQGEELAQQNEELQQQGEELQQQGEELAQQTEELQAQAEDLQVANQELNEREAMLQTLLTALRDVRDERQLLNQVCQAVVQLAGEAVAAAAVVEQVGEQLVVRVHAGAEPLRLEQWPFAHSFAALVMAQGRTAFVDDLAARPDLIVPEPQGRRFRSLLATPLRIHGQAVGALEVYSFTPRQWTQHQFRIIEWAAAQCALALETARLQQAQARLAAIVETSEDAILSKALDGRILTWNTAAERMFGYRAEEIVGQPITKLVPPELWAEEEQILQRLQRGESVAHAETLRLTKGGQRLEVSLTVSPVKDAAGQVIGASKILRDITERKAAERVLARSKEELERLVAERTAKLQELIGELEHFSYSITHDMRAPLRALRGYGEVLEELCAACPQPDQKLYLRRIMTAAERMDALIRDALNYSRAVRQELPLEPVDAGRLLRGMLETYPELQPSQAQVRIEGELPVVLANEAGLTQCFSNLLGNAVKFVRPGQTPVIRIWAERQDGRARIWVEDQGIGIPQLMLPRIFDMFSRGHKKYEGTGIGLALVRKVIARMGGQVGVESQEGQGSRFWLELALFKK